MKILHTLVLAMLLIILLAQCRKNTAKNNSPVNVTLYDKPLPVVQSYVIGKWRLQYGRGGIDANMLYPARNNAYMNITKDSITFGNDSSGVWIHTNFRWISTNELGGYSGYAISYNSGFQYYFINKIHNDTLELLDNYTDAVFYEYTKF